MTMKLHAHTDYAIQILQYLHKYKDALQSAASISMSTGIDYPLVVKAANKLRRRGFIQSAHGRRGGYALGRPAHEISFYDVFVCMEGEVQPHTLGPVRDMQEKMLENMSNMSIAEGAGAGLCQPIQSMKAPKVERMYHLRTADKKIYTIPLDEIILIQSKARGVLELHQKHGLLEFRGQISRIAANVPEFFCSHISTVININHIKHVDEGSRTIELTNGHRAPIAKQKIPMLSRLMETAI